MSWALTVVLIAAAIGVSVPYSLLRFQLRLRLGDTSARNPFLPDTGLYQRCRERIPHEPLFRRWRVFYWLIWAANAVFVAAVVTGAATLAYLRWKP